ncbi:MAG: DMT family transporter [Gaiellaceae bacterium]
MRWNLSIAALAGSWGFISIIVAHVALAGTALAFYRVGIGAVALLVALAAAGRLDLLRVPRERGRLALVSVTLGTHWLLYFLTIKLSSVSVAILLVYVGPIFLAMLAPALLPEARSRVVLAVLPSAAGGIVLVALGGSGGHSVRVLAVVCGLAAALTQALLIIGTKFVSSRLPVPTVLFWSYLGATVVTAPLLATAPRIAPQAGEIGYLLVLGIVFTPMSGLVYVWLLRRVTAQATGVLAYLEPVSAALLAWALLGQTLDWQIVVGGLLVLGSGAVVVLREPAEVVPEVEIR